jgi:hypothetical protein
MINGNIIANNIPRFIGVAAGGVICSDSNPTITNNAIYKNTSNWHGGGLFISGNSFPILINNSVIMNEAASNGGGLYSSSQSGEFLNNIFWKNSARMNGQQIFLEVDTLKVTYSNVQGGWEGEGNIDTDPLFVDSENRNFILKPNSPCIDAGDPDPQFNDIEDPNNPGFALYPSQGTIRNDMGAFGGPYASSPLITSVEEIPTGNLPISFELMQNYPNPFNPETTIQYQLPKEAEVKLVIYNLLGQRVRILVDKKQPTGIYSVQWDGKDESGRNVSSGIYLYRLQTNEFVKVRKLTLLH